ncbi:unnamed protein product, partial [Candidula unifasciata]
TELKTVKERASSYEEEIAEQKAMIDKLRKDLMSARDEHHAAVQEGIAYKQQAHKMELELAGAKEQEKILTGQVEQQEGILGQLQAELRAERERHGETVRQLSASKKMSLDMQADMEALQRLTRELQDRLRMSDDQMPRLRREIDDLQLKHREFSEVLADREAQLRMANLNLQTAQKQAKQHTQEIARYEDTLAQLHMEQEKLQDQHHKSHADLVEADVKIHELRVQVTNIQGNHKESMEQLAEKSRQLATGKTELAKLSQQNSSMKEEIIFYDDKLRKLQQELKKAQEINKTAEEELQHFEERYTSLQMDLVSSQEKQKHGLQELSAREEQIVMLKVEMTALQEKYKAANDEAGKLLGELEMMKQNYRGASEEIAGLRMALEESRANGDRLHRESELVVHNVNTWVQEQKMANEKLGNKIREQSKAIMILTSEKETLLEQITRLQKSYSKTKMELDEKANESDKLRALQSHSAHQQVILNQLKNRLEEHEVEQDKDMKTKEAAIEDLHLRLKANIDSIHKLNQQLASLQKENTRLHNELDREMTTRQNYEMQAQSKDQLIENLKSQLDSMSFKRQTEKADIYKDADRFINTALTKAAEDEGVTDAHSLDKAYWIQRVGELQQSSDYWSDKVRGLSTQLELAKSANIFTTKVY